MSDQYEHKHNFIDLSSVSPQSKFLESYPEPPLATSTLYLNTHTTTNSDGSKNYRLVGVHIVLSKDNPNGLWESCHVDRASGSIDPQNPKVATKSLEIYCDTLEIYGEFSVPEADVSIFARQIIWATPDAAINTSPLKWSIPRAEDSGGTNPGKNGAHGRNAGNFSVFVNEVVDSFTVEDSVTICSDSDYKGQSQALLVGNYDISELGIGNDSLSSLRVPKGLQVTLYEHSGFQGRSKTLTGNASYIGDDFNDITSSIKVEPLKRLIANGGNGQDAGEGHDGIRQGNVIPAKTNETFAWSKAGRGYKQSKAYVNFNPPAIYYEYQWTWAGLDQGGSSINPASGTWGNKQPPKGGDDAIAPGKPGNAGNGGELKTNSALVSQLIINSGGSGGEKAKDCFGGKSDQPTNWAYYRVKPRAWAWAKDGVGYDIQILEQGTVSNGNNKSAPDPDRKSGASPQPVEINAVNSWLHPLSLQKAIEYARDLFLSNCRKRTEEHKGVQDFLDPYHKALSLDIPTQAGAWEDSNNAQWISAQSEIATMLLRLSSHLDYFGNPGGFSPFLSLSSTIKLYEDETQRALKALILSHWISEKAQISGEKSKALQESISVLNKDTQDAAKQILQTEQKIDSTINSINSLSQQLEEKADKLNALREKLLKEAEHDVTQQHQIKFAIKLCAAICQVIPVGQPVLGSVASLASVASNLIGSDDSKKPDTVSKIKESFGKCQEAYKQYKQVAEKAKKEKDSPASENKEAAKGKESAWATVGKGVGPALSQVSEAFSTLKVPQSEVDAELNRLIAKSPEWAEIVKQIQDLNTEKSKLVADLEQSLQVLGDNYARITSNASATVNMRQQVAETNLLLDLEAISFVDQMGQRAKLRLLYSLYLMVKAYEASFLKPISVDWKLSEVTQKIDDFVRDGSQFDLTSLDNWVRSLEPIFKANLDKVRDELLKVVYNVNQKINSLRISFSEMQTPDILNQLNDRGYAEFNPLRYGLVLPSEEQGRISKIELSDIQFDPNHPQLPSDCNMIIRITPAKTGILRRAEGLYSIYSNNPLSWSWTYYNDAPSNIHPSEPSPISEDVLNWILGDQNTIKQKVTQPPIWSDLEIDISFAPPLETKPHIAKLSFNFKIDSEPSPKGQRVLNVQMIGSFSSATIECSKDLACRRGGFDQMIRIYQAGKTVSLSVPSQTEDSYFKQWNLVGQKSQIKQEESFDFAIADNTIAQCYWSTEPIALAFVVLEEGATTHDLPKTENLPLYLTASTEATILGIVSNPHDAEVFEEIEEGWQQVNYKGIVGWIKR